jgi:hypothetical protein
LPELEQQLRALAAAIDWPETPRLTPPLEARRRSRRPLVAAVSLVVLAVAVAFAVPPARSAILRFFHLGGVTIERVDVLPPAQERPLAASLGGPISAAEARAVLGQPFRLPTVAGTPQLYAQDTVVSTLLAAPEPLLLSELQADGPFLLKKVVGTLSQVESADLGPDTMALWITGKPHVLFAPGAPPRLAGNVLLWSRGDLTYRLEGRQLDEDEALRLARQIDGT